MKVFKKYTCYVELDDIKYLDELPDDVLNKSNKLW